MLLLFFTILFFKNPETPTGLVVLENEVGEEIGNYEVSQTEQGYDINIKDPEKPNSEVSIQGITNPPEQIKTKIGLTQNNKELKTEVFAVEEELNFENAILNLKKINDVEYILYCQNFDFENFECENWERTDIPFVDLGDYIQFEVTHFTAYAGGGTSDTASNLTIWDDTDPEGGGNNRYSEGCVNPAGCGDEVQTFFFANYTNNTGGDNQPINDSTTGSNCSISFHINLTSDDDASWTAPVNMTFNNEREQYEYNRTFNYKGVFYFNISCFDDVYVDNMTRDTFTISNSRPVINDASGTIGDLDCTEDEWCYFNLSANTTEPDLNDADSLVYNTTTSIPNRMWFDISTGNISVFCTNESQVFDDIFVLTVDDGEASDAASMRIVVSAVNDAPTFNLTNQTLYEDANNYSINLSAYYSDEENDLPYFRDNWTEGNQTLFINISYAPVPPNALNGEMIFANPTNDDVGNYTLNITVNDTAGNELSKLINFEVRNTNDPPSLDWMCTDNDTNFTATEDIKFECTTNATDDDLVWGDNLTFTANETWFTFEWQSNNESNVSFTPVDQQVGFWWINLTVTDTEGVTDSKLINLTVLNVSDTPVLSTIANFTAYVNVPYSFTINATDGDLNISSGGECLNFSQNETEEDSCYLFAIGDAYVENDTAYSDISFTPGAAKDFCWINFSVNDTDGITGSQLVNVTIRGNTPPSLTATVNNNATEDIEFYINLTWNVTDDDGDEILWSDNTTIFNINSTTGEINFTANDSFVGLNWVNITVRDYPPEANNSQVLNFTVYNVEDVPNFTEPIGNYTSTEDTEFYIEINATDEDIYIPGGNVFNISENLTFSVNDTSLFEIDKVNQTIGIINFTAVNNSQAGLYWFEINVTDSTNRTYNETINITVISVNDAPQFLHFDNITNAQQAVLAYYDFNASDEENGTDTIEGTGNLTFWIANITNATDGNLMDSITLTPSFFDDANEVLNSTTGVFSFTPNATHAGTGIGNKDYKINLSVNDSEGSVDSVIINLSIKNENDAPIINCAFLTASGNFGNQVDITMYENDTNMTFSVTGVKDDDGDTLIFNWTLDNVVNESNSKATSQSGSDWVAADSLNYLPGFLDAGVHNLTLLVFDGTNISTATNSDYDHTCFRNITVLETNSPPQFILTIQNISWNQDTTYTNLDLDNHFSDVENQTDLNFTFDHLYENLSSLASSQITVEVDNTTHVVTFTPASGWYGAEYIQFHASDLIENISSNYVYLNITQTEVTVTTTTSGGGGGGGSSRTQLVTIDIIHPGALTIYKEDLIVSPVIIKNSNKDITLRDIDIEVGSLHNLEISLSKTHIDKLDPGEEREIQLSIRGVIEGFEEIIIKAIVHNPEVTDSAKIFTTVISVPVGIEERIKFVKDLFKENPECLELNELLSRAEKDLASNQYDAALEKLNTAIDKCKDLISTIYKIPETELRKDINIPRVLFLLGLNLASLMVILFVIFKVVKRKKV
ncbi:MAG: hypothetical protein KKA79_09865 [Nanoarchaeota archaeon]|nr:hypothetical protein [Nanoarchaeota archaeon]